MAHEPKTTNHEMKATIFFLYADPIGYDERSSTMETAEKDIRYWLGKSPGTHGIVDVLVVPEPRTDWMAVVAKYYQEESDAEMERRELEERANYERLKKKFEPQERLK